MGWPKSKLSKALSSLKLVSVPGHQNGVEGGHGWGRGQTAKSMLFFLTELPRGFEKLVSSLAFLSSGRRRMTSPVCEWRRDLSLFLYTEAETPSEVFTGVGALFCSVHVLGEEETGGPATSGTQP